MSAVAGTAVALMVAFIWWTWPYKIDKDLPGPPNLPYFGAIFLILKNYHRLPEWLAEIINSHESIPWHRRDYLRDATIDQLVKHGLIGPRRCKRRNWIEVTIQNQHLRFASVDLVKSSLCNGLSDTLRDSLSVTTSDGLV